MFIKLPRLKKTEENPARAVKQLAEYLEALVNQLEKELMQLNNVNMIDLDLDDMRLYTENGTELSSNKLKIQSPDGQVFEVGYDKKKKEFVFTMPKIASFEVETINATKLVASSVSTGSLTASGNVSAASVTASGAVTGAYFQGEVNKYR